MNVVVGAAENIDLSSGDFCGVMVQYPNTYGGVQDWSGFTGIMFWLFYRWAVLLYL
jgi:glycine cleavage system pyridoxal-binding protein P